MILDSTVIMATSYGLKGSGNESRWRAKFSVPVQTGPGYHSALLQVPLFPSSAEIKERVQLYLYPPPRLHGRLRGALYTFYYHSI